MEALVTKASCQAKKIKAAEDQLMEEAISMDLASIEQREKIQGFFTEVWHIFVIEVNELTQQEVFLTTYELRSAFSIAD